MTTPKTRYLVGHTSPDMDCIGALWLLQRYGGLADAERVFVSFADLPAAVLDGAAAVVDIGGQHDPERSRFDHHQDPELPSATMLVYQHLVAQNPGLIFLSPLIDLIDDGDRWGPASASSRLLGIHALLSDWKRHVPRPVDREMLTFGYSLLDSIARHLKHRADAQLRVRNALRWQSHDGLVVALEGGDRDVTEAAGEVLGARLAVWWQRVEGEPVTYSVGCKRVGQGADLHVGDLAWTAARLATECGAFAASAELATWFKHPQGWVAMGGTSKAPRTDAPEVDVATLAQFIDRAWQR